MMIRRRTLLALTATLPSVACAAEGVPHPGRARGHGAENVVTMTNVSGSAVRNHPTRLGRPFRAGEIAGTPQAMLGGVPVPTQADVKTRWPDGSVQHAIMSFVTPHLPSGDAVAVTFRNQPRQAERGIGAEQLLDPGLDFDAVVEISDGTQTHSASARAMVQDGHVWRQFCHGSIAPTFILADHSAARRYDMGFNSLRPVRPIFHVTLWPALRLIQVRVICENANTETLQDIEYSVRVRLGRTKPTEVLSQDNVVQCVATRWARGFWIGKTPETRIDIDHNLAYLGTTTATPTYDTSLEIPPSHIEREYAAWNKLPRNLYDSSGWTKYMPATGGRDGIGPYPDHVTNWLYTGDHRLFEQTSVMAEQAGGWALQVREGNPAKRFNKAQTIPAIGLPVSVYARPTLWLLDDRDKSKPQDSVPIHPPRIRNPTFPHLNDGWERDAGHQPDPYSALYLLTGDPFLLDQIQLWAAVQVLDYNPGYKGPPPSGVIEDQARGCAWTFRNRVNAAFLSPDASPEKPYFTGLINDALAYWEGKHGVQNTPRQGSALWRFGATEPYRPPLHTFYEIKLSNSSSGLNYPATTAMTGLWQHYMLIIELARGRDRGFPAGPLTSWLGEVLIGQFADPKAYPPINVDRYYSGTRDAQGNFFRTWPETLAAYKSPAKPAADVDNGYAAMAYAASTLLVNEPGGREAYLWLRREVFEPLRRDFANTPKWALYPAQSSRV